MPKVLGLLFAASLLACVILAATIYLVVQRRDTLHRERIQDIFQSVPLFPDSEVIAYGQFRLPPPARPGIDCGTLYDKWLLYSEEPVEDIQAYYQDEFAELGWDIQILLVSVVAEVDDSTSVHVYEATVFDGFDIEVYRPEFERYASEHETLFVISVETNPHIDERCD